MSARKLNYDGFEDCLITELNKLFRELSLAYEKEVGRKFDVKNNKFVHEFKSGRFDIHLDDREGMLSLALSMLYYADKEKSAFRLFHTYKFATTLGFNTQNDIDKKAVEKKLKSEAANIRWLKDPKNEDKKFVKDCWLDWRKSPSRYKSKAAFAKDMLTKVIKITSQKVIEDWCRKWEKE